MRILVINSEYPPIGGGAGHASANLARCLAALGHDVVVLAARFEDLPQTAQDYLNYIESGKLMVA